MDDAPSAHRVPTVDNAALRAERCPPPAPFAHMPTAFDDEEIEIQMSATTRRR
jgi:hypothetical protein